MADILIRGMEMPEGCFGCILSFMWFNGTETVLQCNVLNKLVSDDGTKDTNCPLIEVSEDVKPVKYGEWMPEGNDENGNYWDECTVCRDAVWFPPFVKNDYKYCPHCGAKMDGGDDV